MLWPNGRLAIPALAGLLVELRTVIAGCRQVLLLCGSVEERLSKEVVQLEVATEENVLKPLVTILEDDIPSIDKLRRQLHTRTLDMDAAKNRSLSEVWYRLQYCFWFACLSTELCGNGYMT